MVRSVDASEVADLLREQPDGVFLLDVREADEREAAVILPSVHIPMNSIPDRLEEIPRDREVIVYCHTGGRSAMVAAYLEGQGFSQMANLEGGIDAWSIVVDPSIARY
jgi:rhodanese-related sulfurtransferase